MSVRDGRNVIRFEVAADGTAVATRGRRATTVRAVPAAVSSAAPAS